MLDNDEERTRLEGIYEAYKLPLHRYALRITNNKQMSEDSVHNAFLSIIKYKEKLYHLSKTEIRKWIFVITKNKCIDLLRKQNYFIGEMTDEIENSLVSDDVPVETQIILMDEYEAIRKHTASLDEASRLVLEMKYILYMTSKEIGDEMNMTAKHVDTKILRAKEKVRKLAAAGGMHYDK